MKKKVGIIKRVLCIGLVFLLGINTFAAVVSDNDGSAFITKAEFDALKSSFQAQVDTYNHSIDTKIDGAIASYLAGIKLSNKWELKNIDNFNFINRIPETAPQGKNYDFILNRQSRKTALEKLGSDDVFILVGLDKHWIDGEEVFPEHWGQIVMYGDAINQIRYQAVVEDSTTSWRKYCDGNKRNQQIELDDAATLLGQDVFVVLRLTPRPGIETDAEMIRQYIWEDTANVCMSSFMWGVRGHGEDGICYEWFRDRLGDLWRDPDNPSIDYKEFFEAQFVYSPQWADQAAPNETFIQDADDDSEYLTFAKQIFRDWKVHSQSNSLAHMAPGTWQRFSYMSIAICNGDLTRDWMLSHWTEGEGGSRLISLKDLYEWMPVHYTTFGKVTGSDEVNKTETIVNSLEWSANTYGKGFCLDYKLENGLWIPYINGFANSVAAQMYLTTQLHSYSVADTNQNDKNWSDFEFSDSTVYDFLPNYDMQESAEHKQEKTSTVVKNNYWNQRIFPFVNKPTNDNTAFMMVGKHFNDNAARVYCFDNANSLETDMDTIEWVNISEDETETTRAGVWNNEGVITQKLDYIITAGNLKFPTYKITEDRINIYDLYNSNASTVAGELVKVGAGILCATANDQHSGTKVGLKFKVYNTAGNEVSDIVHWKLSDKMFNKCELASGANLFAFGDTPSNTLVNTPQFNAMKDKNEVWLNCYAETDGNIVKVDTFTIN